MTTADAFTLAGLLEREQALEEAVRRLPASPKRDAFMRELEELHAVLDKQLGPR